MKPVQICPKQVTWMAFVLPLLLTACFLPAYLPGQQAIGTLRTIGDQVKVNNRPAIDGDTVMSNDYITTGAKSSAIINCYSCGFLQSDEYWEPRFVHQWQNFNPNIVMDSFNNGQIYVEMKKDCQLTVKPEQPVQSELESDDIKYNVKVNQDETVVTVLKGTVLLRKPENLAISEGEQVIITKEGIKKRHKLTGQELQEVIKWRDKFPEPGPLARAGARKVCECVD